MNFRKDQPLSTNAPRSGAFGSIESLVMLFALALFSWVLVAVLKAGVGGQDVAPEGRTPVVVGDAR